jgi:hypothetical protein
MTKDRIGAKDGDVLILTRDDLIAAFRCWNDDYLTEMETVEQVLTRLARFGADLAVYQTDTLIDYLIEAASEPLGEM